jgi:hypothetical protein
VSSKLSATQFSSSLGTFVAGFQSELMINAKVANSRNSSDSNLTGNF